MKKGSSLKLWLQIHNGVPLLAISLLFLLILRIVGHDLQVLNDRLYRAEKETQSNRERVILLQEKLTALNTPTPTPIPTKSPSPLKTTIFPTRTLIPTTGVKTP